VKSTDEKSTTDGPRDQTFETVSHSQEPLVIRTVPVRQGEKEDQIFENDLENVDTRVTEAIDRKGAKTTLPPLSPAGNSALSLDMSEAREYDKFGANTEYTGHDTSLDSTRCIVYESVSFRPLTGNVESDISVMSECPSFSGSSNDCHNKGESVHKSKKATTKPGLCNQQ